YYAAQAALKGFEFGYELIDPEWALDFSEDRADPPWRVAQSSGVSAANGAGSGQGPASPPFRSGSVSLGVESPGDGRPGGAPAAVPWSGGVVGARCSAAPGGLPVSAGPRSAGPRSAGP